MAKLAPAATVYCQTRPWPALLLAVALALSACEEIKGGLDSANQSLQEALGEDDGDHAKPESDEEEEAIEPSAETLYELALAHKKARQPAEALVHFELAAEKGHREAAFEAALAHLEGQGTQKDLERAAHWMTLESGHSLSRRPP